MSSSFSLSVRILFCSVYYISPAPVVCCISVQRFPPNVCLLLKAVETRVAVGWMRVGREHSTLLYFLPTMTLCSGLLIYKELQLGCWWVESSVLDIQYTFCFAFYFDQVVCLCKTLLAMQGTLEANLYLVTRPRHSWRCVIFVKRRRATIFKYSLQ